MTRLTVLHTNDVHGRVQQVFRLAAPAGRIKQTVTVSGGHYARWDAGDAEDAILYESSMTKGRAMTALLRGGGLRTGSAGQCDTAALRPPNNRRAGRGFHQAGNRSCIFCARHLARRT